MLGFRSPKSGLHWWTRHYGTPEPLSAELDWSAAWWSASAGVDLPYSISLTACPMAFEMSGYCEIVGRTSAFRRFATNLFRCGRLRR